METATNYNFLIVLIVTFGSLTYGYNSAIIGAVIGLPSFFQYFNIDIKSGDGSRITGATNGLFAGGGFIGCYLITWLADKVGRKRSIQITSCLCIVAGALQAGSVHIAMFLVARFLMGMGVGMVNVITPLYQSEVSPAHSRGRMVGSHGFVLCVGYGLAGWTGYGCYFLESQVAQWRLCLALQVVPPLGLLIGSWWVPESPRHLVATDQQEAGFAILKRLHHQPDDEDDTVAREELYQIRLQLDLEKRQGWRQGWLKGWISLFTRKSYRKRLLFGFLLLGLVQSTGCLVIDNYQVLLYNGLSLYGAMPLMLYALWDTWAAIMNLVNALLLDKIGRIPIMVVGQIGCSVSVAGFTACLARYGGTENRVGNGFGVFFLYLFVTFFGGSMDASSYVYSSEIFPTSIRAQGAGFSVSGLFAFSLIYTMCAPVAFNNIGWKYYLIFIIVPLFGATIMYLFYPETKGLALEEIAAKFGDEVAVNITDLSAEERARLGKSLVNTDIIELEMKPQQQAAPTITIRKNNPWETKSEISGLIPLPERDVSLFAHASGPPRLQGEPVVILFTGAGGPAATYVKVQEHLSSFARTLFYDRAGYDRSTLPSNVESLMAHDAAHDLDALLGKIDVPPPYILIGHSYGGVPLREFLHLQLAKHRPSNPLAVVGGIVLYDTGTEAEYAFWPRLPSADLVAVCKDVDWEGLTHLREESGMTDDEWASAMEASRRMATKLATKREDTHASARSLAERRQLEHHAYRGDNVAVIRCNSARDYRIGYEEGVRLGGGTEDERRGAKKFIEDWSLYTYGMVKVQVDLVGQHGNALYQELMDWGHDSPFRKPELVGDAVEWVLNELRKQKESH